MVVKELGKLTRTFAIRALPEVEGARKRFDCLSKTRRKRRGRIQCDACLVPECQGSWLPGAYNRSTGKQRP